MIEVNHQPLKRNGCVFHVLKYLKGTVRLGLKFGDRNIKRQSVDDTVCTSKKGDVFSGDEDVFSSNNEEKTMRVTSLAKGKRKVTFDDYDYVNVDNQCAQVSNMVWRRPIM